MTVSGKSATMRLMAGTPIVMRKELRLAVPARDLWPLVSNTGRFNKSLGLPEMTTHGWSAADPLSKEVSARLYGLTLRWREQPFEWAERRFFRGVRVFESGPFERFEGCMTLEAEGDGTRVVVESAFTPRHALGAFIVRYAAGRRALADAEAMLKRFEASLKSGGDAFPARRTKSPASAAALARKAEQLHESPVDRAAASQLLRFVEHAYDDELSRMRPFELADRWGLDRLSVLKTFLYAAKSGLLDLTWEVLCPNCAGANARPGSLKELSAHGRCDSCDLGYDVSLDETIEVRFTVSAAVRASEAHTFCVGNPAQTPHALAQLVLRPGPERRLEVELESESYLLRDLEGKKSLRLRPSERGARELAVDEPALARGGELAFKPGPVRLAIRPGKEPTILRLERESWRDRGAKASLVTTLQEFRDLFSAEVLAPGVEMAVRSIALLFSDLKDSTALYEAIGDATAYALVRAHFDYLFDIVRRRNGAVVKTIGDAVMAAFSRPGEAVEAALDMQERLDELNGKLAPRPPVVLKVGVHEGPAIAINTDGVLDYFGTTVNVAARIQGESKGSDVVISEKLYGEPEVQEALSRHGAKVEALNARLKGLADEHRLRRLTAKE